MLTANRDGKVISLRFCFGAFVYFAVGVEDVGFFVVGFGGFCMLIDLRRCCDFRDKTLELFFRILLSSVGLNICVIG